MKKIKRALRLLLRLILWGLVTVILVIGISNGIVYLQTQDRLYSSLEELPKNKVGVVPGTGQYLANGNLNRYFKYRIDAAVALYKAGKIEYILVSGDNGHKSYNEPRNMRNALIKKGVPPEKIYSDYAGFRTLDTVVRSYKVFGQQKFTFISQDFQNRRAIYIGLFRGINAVGYNARDVSLRYDLKTKVREMLARVKMMLDIHVINKQPKFLGDPVEIK